MSLDRIIATGRGKLQARLEIEGWPAQPVTRGSMVQVLADGRKRVAGLKFEGLKLAARLDLPTGKMEAQGFSVSLVDPTPAREIIEAFRKRPTHRTYLADYVSRSATTIPVFSTAGWPSSGVLHINTEAIRYTGTTGTTFTGCTRGWWNTEPQAHFVQGASAAFEADSAALAYPPVTDRPASLEGRRAFLHLYGEGDSPLGEGTQRWQGVCVTSPKFDGLKVTFNVDPPTAILKQAIGGDVAEPIGIRGIYYPWSQPFYVEVSRGANANRYSTAGTTPIRVKVAGFFETQAAFCGALTAELASRIAAAGWGIAITARPTAGGFELVHVTPNAGQRWLEVNESDGAQRARFSSTLDEPAGQWVNETTGEPAATSLNASTSYTYRYRSAVPRAYFGRDTPLVDLDGGAGIFTEPTLAATWPSGRIYLAGLVALSDEMAIAEEGDPIRYHRVGSVNTGARFVSMGEADLFYTWGPSTRFRLGRVFARGNVGDLVEELVTKSPEFANAGAMPLVRDSDVSGFTSAAVRDAGIPTPASTDRAFVAFGQDCTLEELIGPELVAAGLHWTLDAAGRLSVRPARLAASSETATLDIRVDPTRDVGAKPVGQYPTLEEGAIWGFVSDLAYLTGYDPIEDEHTGPEVRFPNVAARSPTRVAKKLEVAQKSIPGARLTTSGPVGGVAGEPTQEDIGQFARFWLGLLGGTYDILTIRVGAAAFNTRLGDTVSVTSRYVPNDAGGMGVTGLLGVLIGYAWDLDTMSGTLELLTHSRPIAGYAPEFRVAAPATDLGGDAWQVQLNVAEESDEPIGTWFKVGDRILMVQWDSFTPIEVQGAITVIVNDDTVRVQLDDGWAGSTDYTIRPDRSDLHDLESNLARFAFVASSGGRIDHNDGSRPARELAP